MKPAADRVVKIGGSLLDWAGLQTGLADYLAETVGLRTVLVVGGGHIVEHLRLLDRLHGLGEDRCHRLALQALDLTAQLLAGLCSEYDVRDGPEGFAESWKTGRYPLLASGSFFERIESGSADPLPRSWETTSDSIAARIAVWLGAQDLVLLKRVAGPAGLDVHTAVRMGLVDPSFPTAARGLERVSIRDLTDARGELVRLKI